MTDSARTSEVYDVLVIGGGVVGLSILRSAALKGWKCALVEAESELLKWASGSNSGIVCTGVDASPGTLERALIRDSVARVREFCRDHNIPTRPCGSLVCQWPWDQPDEGHTLSDVLLESHDAGDTHAAILSAKQVQQLEPNLSKSCVGAVHIPGEIVVDPWLFSVAYAVHARENGAQIFTNWKFDPDASNFDGKTWTAVRSKQTSTHSSSGPAQIKARSIVNATGLWSAEIQAKTLQKSSSSKVVPRWEARPRRGQYRVFQATPNTMIQTPIQPIPTQRTKGIFVFSTLYDQICVGPTALDQESKTDRSVDPAVSQELSDHAKKIIAGLDTSASYVGDYVGLRPGTDKRDYQIHLSPEINWIASAGIRSTGLTGSLGIGRHVVHLLGSVLPERTAPLKVTTTPLPSIDALVEQFHRLNGFVAIGGHSYRVTHPVTKMGWSSRSGLADAMNSREGTYKSKL